jgi:predicted DCC family thiol-disulfide oxidoreductase YuxK
VIATSTDRPILFFDGYCNLCTRSVQFVIRHDRQQQFLFASLQSKAGKEALAELMRQNDKVPDSLVLYYKGRYYTQSDAALRMAKLLKGMWPALSVLLIIPRFIRNSVYHLIARNRYKWFGKREECMIPTPELKARFLEE